MLEATPHGMTNPHLTLKGVAGGQVREGLHYNPYFPGGAIAMPKMLADGGTEYDDETPATESQQSKVCTCTMGTVLEARASAECRGN